MKKTITTIITILVLAAITLTTFASCGTNAITDDYTEISYTEGFEVSSLNLVRTSSSTLRFYVALRNDNHSTVVEIDEELFASLTVGDVVIAEVLEKTGNGVTHLILSNIEIYYE